MKVRIEIPHQYQRDQYTRQEFIDEVMMWGLETEIDIDYYTIKTEYENNRTWGRVKHMWAVFIVEADMTFLFTLRWGALLHKA